ncbi:MAG: hypothetical protein IJH99_04915 [Eubacterium sp.]|nr:hypothetical protein [Eubacterium sp.]
MKDKTLLFVRIACVVLVAVIVLKGCSDTLAMRNCFYVLIPYILEVVFTFVTIGYLVKKHTTPNKDIEKRAGHILLGVTFFLFVFTAAAVIAMIVFLVLNAGTVLEGSWQYPLIIAADTVAAVLVFLLRKKLKAGEI